MVGMILAVCALSAAGLWTIDEKKYGKAPAVAAGVLLGAALWAMLGAVAMGLFG